MSRRKNETNRSGAMLGINIYTGKIQKKKKVATLTTKKEPDSGNRLAQVTKTFYAFIIRLDQEDCKYVY